MKWLLALVCFIIMQTTFAGVVPTSSVFDKRVRIVEYNPLDVYELTAHYGYQLHIVLGPTEVATYVTAGDDLGWIISPKVIKNHIFLKPKETKPTTNLSVVTINKKGEEHTYEFHLTAEWPAEKPTKHSDMMYHVRFEYPDAESKSHALFLKADEIKEKLAIAGTERPRNYRYSFSGSDSLEPEEIFDDGLFTYIKFPAKMGMPSVYHANEDGSEQLTDFHDEDEWHVIHRVSARFIFRKDNAVAGVFNDAFDPKGTPNRTGTVSPEVKRVLRNE